MRVVDLKLSCLMALAVSIAPVVYAAINTAQELDRVKEDRLKPYKSWSFKAYQDVTSQRGRYSVIGREQQIVFDKYTNLYWERQASTHEMTWNKLAIQGSAQSYCAMLRKGGNLDWRVPSIAELQSLVDYTIESGPTLNQQVFPNSLSNVFWTSMNYVASPQYAWGFFFQNADLEMNPIDPTSTFGFNIRCVRGPKMPLQDRFTDQRGQTLKPTSIQVLDRATGFIWQRVPSQKNFNFEVSVEYCQQLSLGEKSWRLPKIKELLTILDYSKYKPSIDEAVFPDTFPERFWSATPFVGQSDSMWGLSFGHGRTSVLANAQSFMVRCVRNRQL